MKPMKKALRRLEARRQAYDNMGSRVRSKKGGLAYRRPGSMKVKQ